MTPLLWIVLGGLAMTAIALVGSVTLLLEEATLKALLLPLVAFAAGSLMGGAFFHMIPEAIAASGSATPVFLWLMAGFTLFLVLEQFLHWHHAHRVGGDRPEPRTYLVLIGDGVHNLMGGLAVGGAFLVDLKVGLATWLAAAAHEVPQELGDFAVLVHGGWHRSRALLLNAGSGLTFLIGGLAAWAASFQVDVTFLLPLAAGNFLYIAAADLIPELKEHKSIGASLLHTGAFLGGLGLLYAIRRLSGLA